MKPIPPEQKTAGGIIIPDQTHERHEAAAEIGEVLAIGELAFTMGTPNTDDFFVYDTRPKPGQRVTYTRYAGASVEGADGEEYRIMNDDDVTSVLEEANE